MRQPNFSLDSFSQALQPCVYAWRRGSQWLYVGMSGLGLKRPFNRHHIIGIAEPVLGIDRLDVWVFPTPTEASLFEGELIREQRPQYNAQVPVAREAPPANSKKRVPLNCLVAPQTLEVIRLLAEQRGISQGVLIDWALQEQEVDATEPPHAAARSADETYDPHTDPSVASVLRITKPPGPKASKQKPFPGPLVKPKDRPK